MNSNIFLRQPPTSNKHIMQCTSSSPSPLHTPTHTHTHPHTHIHTQESSFLEELKGKLRCSEVKAAQLEATNRQLSHTLTEVKDKYCQSVAEVR